MYIYGIWNILILLHQSISQYLYTHFSCVKFHTETSNLICSANQMTGFCMRWNTGLNWVKLKYESILFFFNTSEAVTRGVLWKNVFLKIWQYPQKTVDWKHLCWSLQTSNFIKKRLQHRCFSVNIVKFSRIPILKDIYERLLLRSFLRTTLNIS